VCGRYASSRRDDEFISELEVTSVDGDELPPTWNLAPTQPARIVLERRPGSGDPRPARQLRTLRWGLIPSWATDPRIGSRLINARKETETERPAFATAVSRRRCLVPADGYYEWERRPGMTTTVPHYLHDGGRLLTFAGLYEFWPNPAVAPDDPDRWVASFTIVTTRAPDTLGHIHDRSPLVIPPELRSDWLDPTVTDIPTVVDLLSAVPAPSFDAYEVGTAVNDHRNNGPHLMAPAEIQPV
jgi:putative SOS response-associated peptidase YedK